MIIENNDFPQDLRSAIGLEKVDFCIKTTKNSESKALLTVIILIFFSVMISIYFNLKSVFDYVGIDLLNPLKVTRNIDSESFLDVFYFIILRVLPLLIPIYLTIFFLRKYIKNKGQRIYVGTENKLILYKNGIEYEFLWKEFNGNVEFELEKNVLILELRKGSMPYKTIIESEQINQNSVQYSPEVVRIYEVDNILEVIVICQTRIKQHDPTPLNN